MRPHLTPIIDIERILLWWCGGNCQLGMLLQSLGREEEMCDVFVLLAYSLFPTAYFFVFFVECSEIREKSSPLF